jgi:hypothetical protein
MIHALAVGNSVEVKISGSKDDFQADLDAFKTAVGPKDRVLDKERGLWIVSSPERYAGSVIYIQRALQQKKVQTGLPL